MENAALIKRNELIKKVNSVSDSPEEVIMFLMAFLDGLTRNTFSGDVMALAYYDAIDACKQLGIPKETADEIWKKLRELWESRRSPAMREMFADIGETC